MNPMKTSIRNIYCVGRNYRLHAAELGNEVPKHPMLFMKPTHAAVPLDGRTLTLPASLGEIHYETELVVHIGPKANAFDDAAEPTDWIDAFALGLDLTLRDVQSELKAKQHPWLKAKGFRGSAPLTDFLPIGHLGELSKESFVLKVNGEERQKGHIDRMIFDLATLLGEIHRHYGLGEGDIVFTGTPEGVGPVREGDRMALYWGGRMLGDCGISLR